MGVHLIDFGNCNFSDDYTTPDDVCCVVYFSGIGMHSCIEQHYCLFAPHSEWGSLFYMCKGFVNWSMWVSVPFFFTVCCTLPSFFSLGMMNSGEGRLCWLYNCCQTMDIPYFDNEPSKWLHSCFSCYPFAPFELIICRFIEWWNNRSSERPPSWYGESVLNYVIF